MHCPSCQCEYPDWLETCPPCDSPLEASPAIHVAPERHVDYAELVELVAAAGGSLSIELSTSAVGIERTFRFLYRGLGYAWAERMSGRQGDLDVELQATEVGRHHESAMLHYIGYGYAWTKVFEGTIAGNPARLQASKVEMEKKTRFFFRGYGFAWTQEMSGSCGDRLHLALCTTEVARKQRFGFPYQGYGLAWARHAQLAIRSK